ncbi:putative pre-16S rRNA nuclease [Marchantia polymorpha subsp. ruderalis]|uniref:YqgF/RNase H-like domain-containing protein n=2 Tax=Marchantia polymorpha TaxID=3197 RepID=A0A176WHD5_MARPO|nr:hypothetical protein AXG93_3242s1600 [Marchantia polymorpha subsp. ruderalis]PTQ44009.1 hypothetical protein MARPO_0022s0110 [Marchantia polymorpha]BBN04395.1 hypothetical protein Mp_3g04210 [Marchantia polymorpha subsp. ruderalis]|eukprot:PTQ44009.1 hypothetical protein MARPO_0022s0110 [Marchantia polymorpha]
MKPVTLNQLQEVVKCGGRLLGMDVGVRNVGFAMSDHECRVASPHSVIYRSQSTTLSNIVLLDDLVRKHSIRGLVVGYPLELAGHRSNQELMVKSFISELQLSGRFQNLPYLYWDERLTTAAVTRTLSGLQMIGHQRKTILDKMSALGILQDCMDNLWRLDRDASQC